MRFSLVTSFDYNTELAKFKAYCKVGFNGMSPEKVELLKTAIMFTREKNVLLDLNQLKEVLSLLAKCKKLDRNTKDTLKE